MTRHPHSETIDDGFLPRRRHHEPLSEHPLLVYFGFLGVSLLFIGGITLASLTF